MTPLFSCTSIVWVLSSLQVVKDTSAVCIVDQVTDEILRSWMRPVVMQRVEERQSRMLGEYKTEAGEGGAGGALWCCGRVDLEVNACIRISDMAAP
jgi:hypothetical protein